MLTVEVTYDARDYARANTFIINRKPAMWIIRAFPAAVVIGMAIWLYQVAREDWEWWAAPAFLGLLLYIYLGLYFMQRWNLRRIFRAHLRSSPSAQSVQVFNFAEDGIRMTGALHNLEIKWDAIVKALESRHDFFLYFAKNSAYFLPKRAFESAEHQSELRGLLKRKLGESAKLE
jgi:hypothetical protein